MATNLAYIEKMLRAGKLPEQLGGKDIGGGVSKRAYFFDSPNGGFVVKLNRQNGWEHSAQKLPPTWIRKYGARAPRTYKAGEYIIQEHVTVLATIDDWRETAAGKQWREMYLNAHKEKSGHDVHEWNCGVDSNGGLVVFDW